ncbi:MAG: AAA family ATPase [Candidatus Thorarchaeota archaeon]|jgi:O-phosphoseryl-tRNA(Sec) kinase
MKQFLLVLCGIPASGKTSFAREIRNQIDESSQVEIVSTDKWRDEEYYSSFSPENEKHVRESALKRTEFLLSVGVSVIHDDTNYYTSMRHELYDLARINECVFAVVYIATPLDIALEWNLKRDIIIPEHVIRRIQDKIDEPGKKYSWDKPIAKVDLTSVRTTHAALKIIHKLKTMKSTTYTKPDPGETIHTLRDKVTRHVVTRFLRENRSLRTNDDVHQIRKSVLQIAKKNKSSVKETKEHLEWELSKLARRVS